MSAEMMQKKRADYLDLVDGAGQAFADEVFSRFPGLVRSDWLNSRR